MAVNQAMLQALARQKAATKTPTGLKSIAKPKDIQDIFDEQLAGAAEQQFPNVWRPKSLVGKDLEDYATFLYGADKVNLIKQDAIRNNAPTFFAAIKSKNPYEQTLAQLVEAGASPTEIKSVIEQDWKDNDPGLASFPVTSASGDALSAASSYADTLFSEYNKAINPAVKDFLNANDKGFKANLPNAKLTYGARTNLSKGVIGVDTINDSVKSFIDTNIKKISDARAAAPTIVTASSYMDPTAYVVDTVTKKKQTPFKDEALRRQRLKDRNIKP
jgi:hypothetical protein